MIKSVVVHETRGDIEEIDIDLLPEKNEIANLLGGNATFLGQWEDDLVVILVRANTENLELNANKLPRPYTNMRLFGKILLIRMDEESEPQDFTLREYETMVEESTPRTRRSMDL
jgi:hypothetical protein|tara:strand:+ start:657 stop:1001 length:345 start_codon:yes stop_codon:yes gene_type:complete